MGVGTCIALHPKVLVVEVYKLAAIEGKNPESRLRMCEDERALLSSGVSNFVVCLVFYSRYVGGLQRWYSGDRSPRPFGSGNDVVVLVGGIAEPCLDYGNLVRGPVLYFTPVEQ